MAWSDKLKLNKQLVRSAIEAGYAAPKEIQEKTLPRINGGQDVIIVGPGGCGKTTTYILAVLNRIRYDAEGVPRVLILVADKERVLDVTGRFELLNKNKNLLIVGLYPTPGTEAQMNALADGADIVVATPDRARAIYLKLGLNLNKTDLFIVDDADLLVKQGLQLPVAELANSIGKCQHLVFTEVIHPRLTKMIEPFTQLAAVVEVEETGGDRVDVITQLLYHVPNFGTKLNLLNLFMQDEELFTKTIVFVNTRQTAEKVFQSLYSRLKDAAVLAGPAAAGNLTEEFKRSAAARVLVAANEDGEKTTADYIPFLLHFELPPDKATFIDRIAATAHQTGEETLAISFVTDLELGMVKKIEQSIGQKLPFAGLPGELVIEKEKTAAELQKHRAKKQPPEPVAGEAFHQKAAGNAKTHNFSAGQKAKMNNKRKHS